MLARENPTLLRQICEWLDGWVKKIKAAFEGVSARHEEARILMEKAEELQRLWDQALAEAVQNRENERAEDEEKGTEGSKKAADKDGGRVQYSIDPGFAKAIEEWDGKKDTTFRLGSTSKALQSIGVKDTGIIWHSAKIRKILHDHPEMSRSIIKQVPNIL